MRMAGGEENMLSEQTRPESQAYAFLFDGSADGLPDPQLPFFTAAILEALSRADPNGRTRAQLRVGLPSLSSFAERTSAVRGTTSGSGRTVSHDRDIYKYVVWDWLDSLGEGWSSIDREKGQEIFRRHTSECIAISALDADILGAMDVSLKTTLGYVGGFAIDPGNPVHRVGFFEQLIYAAAIEHGAIFQERSYEGDEHWALEGADRFSPGGLVWKPYGWLATEGPLGLPRTGYSNRGASSAENVARKQTPSVAGRVLEAMMQAFFLNSERKVFEFESADETGDVLEAMMPEGKFTKYLFDREHKDGRSKATFLIDVLGIEPEDWRYLAAQFYFGLLMAQPEVVRLNEWKEGYNARFDVTMRVRSRSGNIVVLLTGWNMNPGKLPSLSTALPGDRNADAVEAGDPPILPPGARNDADWARLWEWANSAGIRAGQACVPTPLYIVGYEPISEGECGGALVRVADAQTGMARWLRQQGIGHTDGYGGAVISSPLATQSVDRATAWARAVTAVLRLNGITANFEKYLT